MQDMQEQGESQYDFASRPFEVSRLSSSKQLDKLSERLSSCSKNRKSSMMDAFDFEQSSQKIDSRKASNVDDQSSNRPHRLSQPYTKEKDSGAENYQMFDEVPDFTAIDKFQELHQCLCSKANCNEDGCPCMLAVNQQCIVGICCRVCIQKKNQLFFQKPNNIVVSNKQKKKKQSKQHQHTKQQKKQVKRPPKSKVDKQKYEFAFCSCKKSHCLKKYCPCFAANKKCNQCCACDDCQNKSQAENDDDQLPQRKLGVLEGNEHNSGTNGENSNDHSKSEPIYIQMAQQDIDNYFQQSPLDYSNVELNREMNFQPVDFAQYRR